MPTGAVAASVEAATSSTKLDSAIAYLIDPFFAFSIAWAIGGHVVGNILCSTKVDHGLRECLLVDATLQEGKKVVYRQGQEPMAGIPHDNSRKYKCPTDVGVLGCIHHLVCTQPADNQNLSFPEGV